MIIETPRVQKTVLIQTVSSVSTIHSQNETKTAHTDLPILDISYRRRDGDTSVLASLINVKEIIQIQDDSVRQEELSEFDPVKHGFVPVIIQHNKKTLLTYDENLHPVFPLENEYPILVSGVESGFIYIVSISKTPDIHK